MMNEKVEKANAYTDLAGLYDLLMDDVDYDTWADYYIELLHRAGVFPTRLCDCACGTGEISLRLAGRGIDVIGADISEEMLQRAQQRSRQAGLRVMFVKQDMRELRLPRPVDAIVCACDGVNYLLDDESLRAFFSRARASLKPGGALAFDISSAWKLKNVLGNGFFGEERDDIAYLWSNRFDDQNETVTMDLTFFVRQSNDLYRRFTEIHVQKAHDENHIIRLLKDSGFSGVEVFGDKTFNAPTERENRIHFLATT